MKTIVFTILVLGLTLINKSYSQNGLSGNEIIFHDYNPDIMLIKPSADTLKIDVDNDSINDFMFYLIPNSTGNLAFINPLLQNCAVSYISYFPSDTLSSSSLYWYTGISQIFGRDDKVDKIGIKIIKDASTYYGWIRVYFTIKNMDNALNIDKYAFCTIPDYPLLWGQTELTGTKEIKVQDKIKVTVDGHSQIINIQSKEVVKEISLINSEGRVIRKWRNIKSSKVGIPSEGIGGGVYVLSIKTENNEVVTEKIVL